MCTRATAPRGFFRGAAPDPAGNLFEKRFLDLPKLSTKGEERVCVQT